MKRVASLEVSTRMVGGDYFDIIELQDGNCAMTIADVSGKGVPAALLLALFRSAFRIEAKTLRYDRKSGALTVLLKGGPVEGKAVVLTPAPTGYGALFWSCRTVDVPERYLPASCR